MNNAIRPIAGLPGAVAALLLGGCATLSQDHGFRDVESAVRDRAGHQVKWLREPDEAESLAAEIRRRLAVPLSPEDAVGIALLNNRGLQATYAQLGIAEADLVQAGRWTNPRFSFTRLVSGGTLEIERSVFVSVINLITAPLATRVERQRFELAKLRVAEEALRVAAETRKAWHAAVAARETLAYLEQAKIAADAGAELAVRMARAGNWSRLNELRELGFQAEISARLVRARQGALAERERLTRLMGLNGDSTRLQLPERLPELPAAARELSDIESQALARRLDIEAARREVEALAEAIGLARVTGYVNALELGYLHNTEAPRPRQTGWELDFRLPVFDWGDARVARSQHVYMQAFNHAAQLAVNARSEVREAYAAYRAAFEAAARYRDEIVPLRKRISEENLLRYNGMLISVFELLADARAQVASVSAYIEALRDYWVADADLQMVLTSGSAAPMTSVSASALAPQPGAMPGGH